VLDARRRGKGGDALVPIPSSPPAFLTSPLLSLRGRLRTLGEPFVPPRAGGGEESVAAFVRRRLGREFLDNLVTPFVAGISAGDPERMSLRWALPALHAMETRHGGLLRGALAMRKEGAQRVRPVSFAEGLGELPRALCAALGDRVMLFGDIERIGQTPGGFEVALGGGPRLHAQHLVLATPAPEAARLLVGFAGPSAAIAAVEYAPIVSLALGFEARAFRKVPEGFGYLAGPGAARALAGCLYTSSLFPDRAPEGRVALTVLAGGTAHAEIIDWPVRRILDAVMDDLRRGLGPLPEPVFHRLSRWPRAIPQMNLGHGRVLGEVEALARSFPGLHLTGAYLGGPSLAGCIEGASRVARSILEGGTEKPAAPAAGTPTAETRNRAGREPWLDHSAGATS
jgi:oxygen-dependent protoporphyrinogen oxidase